MFGNTYLMRTRAINVYKFARATSLRLWTRKELIERCIAESKASKSQAKRLYFESEEDLAKIDILDGKNCKFFLCQHLISCFNSFLNIKIFERFLFHL